jgi:hypothetical protein
MTDEEKEKTMQKWGPIWADAQLTKKTYSTLGALNTLAQHWVENEIIIERAAVEEVETNGPKWKPDTDDQDSMGEFFAERDMARYMHDNTLLPMHRYSCIVMLFTTVERELIRLVENLEKGKVEENLRRKSDDEKKLFGKG